MVIYVLKINLSIYFLEICLHKSVSPQFLLVWLTVVVNICRDNTEGISSLDVMIFLFTQSYHLCVHFQSSGPCPGLTRGSLDTSVLSEAWIWGSAVCQPVCPALGNSVQKSQKSSPQKNHGKHLAFHSDQLDKTIIILPSNMTVLIIPHQQLVNLIWITNLKISSLASFFQLIDLYGSSVWWLFMFCFALGITSFTCSKAGWVNHGGSVQDRVWWSLTWASAIVFAMHLLVFTGRLYPICIILIIVVTLVLPFNFLDQDVFMHLYL